MTENSWSLNPESTWEHKQPSHVQHLHVGDSIDPETLFGRNYCNIGPLGSQPLGLLQMTQTWSIFLFICTEPSILMPIHMHHISDSQFVLMLIQRIWPFKKLTLQVAVVCG